MTALTNVAKNSVFVLMAMAVLSILIEDPNLREKMGKEGRKKVIENYTRQVCAPRLYSILTRVAERPARGRCD
jgi:glycosyltransferase involved in cell wall biosynthesis